MNDKKSRISLSHGSGGKLSRELTVNLFSKAFENKHLEPLGDAAIIDIQAGKIAFTTDSFVIHPIFFPGGDIGKLAVCGTVNDLSVMGACPLYLSCSMIIEEGLEISVLEKIVLSMKSEANKAGVNIVCGDTKVVERGHADRIFINTSGIGGVEYPLMGAKRVARGDKIIVNGPIGDHGVTIICARGDFKLETALVSDCEPLNSLIFHLFENGVSPKWMRDPTRGGLASALNELVENQEYGILLEEKHIPVRPEVAAVCELLGFDPLYLANEGKVLMVVSEVDAEKALGLLRDHPYGSAAAIIGEITNDFKGRVIMHTGNMATRIIDMMIGDQLPRIC